MNSDILKISANTIQRSNYDRIADEYYNKIHKTSRNFDAAALDFFERKQIDLAINPLGLVLELGAGIGRTIKYCKINSNKIIQADISRSMLLLSEREPCHQRIVCDALNLPFHNSVFSMVTAFFFDPYNMYCPENDLSIYRNISYLLEKGGLFLGTLPHIMWGSTLRKIRKQSKTEARFLTRNKNVISFNSFLMNDESIEKALIDAGLTLVEMHDLKLPKKISTKDVSKDIIDAARAIGIDEFSLPIVKLILAKK